CSKVGTSSSPHSQLRRRDFALQCFGTEARHNLHLARTEGWAKMDTPSQWDALKVALQREAEDIFYSAGEVVVVESSGISEFELLVISRTKHLKVSYVPERSAGRWETPKEYGFEPMSGPVALLAATLMRLVYRR